MPTALFRNAVLKHFHVILKEGGPICRAKFSATYSDNLMKDQEWPELPDVSPSMKIETEFIGGETFVLTPVAELKMHEISVPCVSAQKFEVVRVQDDDSSSVEIRFEILTNDPSSVVKMWDYLRTVGDQPAVLKMRYSQQATIGEEEPEEKQQTLVNTKSVISFDENPKSPLAAKKRAADAKLAVPDVDDVNQMIRPPKASVTQ
jgi:hypothetical protein